MSKIDLDSFEGFTPGPWSRQSEWDVWCDDEDQPNAPLFRPNMDYRRWGRDISHDERIANASLAAAAPDLLALAKEQQAEIARLQAAIDIAKEFIDNQSDVVDGDYGEPAPNAAMQCLNDIAFVLGEKP